ncbi:hypothetical protein CL689_04015 [Candidatus Saccharibacteria bacterium]|nr:hypothetical protein [Candidatus Saccharibacteria bacterium]|tara:strand:- start:3924 stop:4565 length:642 start_codon:yes stop_codon:yes gene_type:complete
MKRRYSNKVDSLENFLRQGESVSCKSVAVLNEKTCGPTFLPGPAGDVECLAYLCALDDVANEIKGWAHETCRKLINDFQKSRSMGGLSSTPFPLEAVRDISRKGEFASLMLDRVHKKFGHGGNQVAFVESKSRQNEYDALDRGFLETRKMINLLEQENMLIALRKSPSNRELLMSYGASLGASVSVDQTVFESNILESSCIEVSATSKASPKV